MNADKYTKTVFTIIAAALVGILVQNTMKPSVADTNMACGTERLPCFVVPGFFDNSTGFYRFKACAETDQPCFTVRSRS